MHLLIKDEAAKKTMEFTMPSVPVVNEISLLNNFSTSMTSLLKQIF